MVGDFGEGFGGSEAERDGEAGPAADGLADFLGEGKALSGGSRVGEGKEGFVNGVDFEVGGEVGKSGHDAVAEVAVEGVVGGEGDDVVFFYYGLALEEGLAHFNTEGFGFLAAGDDAAVVVGEDHQRAAFEFGVEDALAGGVEIVAIHQGEERFGHSWLL